MFMPLKIHTGTGQATELLFRCGASESLLGHEDGALVRALVHLEKRQKRT